MSQQKFIVGIGSSAGGLEALQEFFDATPHDNATYIILRHMPMDYQTCLVEIMRKHSTLAFQEAQDGMRIEKDKVYFPPASMYMTTVNDFLFLKNRPDQNAHPNRSVDEFFHSLAISKGQNGIGVILSGSGSDGMKGISSVKVAGGLTIAQRPETCAFPSMPENAIATGNVDAVLSPSEMPSHILQYIQSKLSSQVYI